MDVVRAVTVTPARALRLDRDGFGTIAAGGPAHLTVFRMQDGPLELEDASGELRVTERWFDPVAVFAW